MDEHKQIAVESDAERDGDDQNEVVVPIIPVRNMVLFPGVVLPISIGRPKSVAAAQEAAKNERPIGLLMQRDPQVDEPVPEDLYLVGTVASILRYVTAPDGSHHIICQGQERFRVIEFVDDEPFLAARIERLQEHSIQSPALEAQMMHLKKQAMEALELLPQAPAELGQALQHMDSAGQLADLIANFMDIKPEEKQKILETVDWEERLEKVSRYLAYRLDVLRLSKKIGDQASEVIDKRQREYVLREQMRAIQKELGEDEDAAAEIREIEEAIAKAGMPEEVEQQARKELKRLERMPEGSAEYPMVRTYLEWLTELPWSVLTPESLDIAKAREILDQDHYDLDKIKRRILEHLAVRKLNPKGKSPILCFVGPPGVGKTSLGQSIARAMERKFVRVSLGGVHDEAELRGHRRTYIGAMPGNIVQAIRKAGSRNPVIMLDEIDKLGAGGFHGDPAAALLEILDPEQNATFRDNYLGVPFDLSQVMFIATANRLDTIPGPLRDRMEVIELPGYTEEEKVQIARSHLLRRQLEQAGLTEEQCRIEDSALHALVRYYTREAGVRNLEREIGALCRHAAMKIAEGQAERLVIGADDLPDILGPHRFESEVAQRVATPGVATGLAWTPVGGDILFIEATAFPGHGKLILTGQLGDVMKESAQAALSLVKANAEPLGIDSTRFDQTDIHIHVPAGAIPKDGPSAGVAIYVALVSLLTGRTVRADTAMTGEISLRGLVMPVGGIKEKVLAALRAGIKQVLLPAQNRKEYEEIPENAREQLHFEWLNRVDEAVALALDSESERQSKGETSHD